MKYISLSFFLCVSFLFSACALQTHAGSPAATYQGTVVPPDAELEKATTVGVGTAQIYGMKEKPTEIEVKKTVLSEAFALQGMSLGSTSSKFGFDPNRPVYIMILHGAGTWSGPGDPGGDAPPVQFDRMRLIVAADTFDVIGVVSVRPGDTLLLELPAKSTPSPQQEATAVPIK